MSIPAVEFQSAAFHKFQGLCKNEGILERPGDFEEDDVVDGLTDDSALM
jgi:hypothetical protein